jgi:hypothetical protein
MTSPMDATEGGRQQIGPLILLMTLGALVGGTIDESTMSQ